LADRLHVGHAFDLSIPLDRMADVQTIGQLAGLIDDLRAKV